MVDYLTRLLTKLIIVHFSYLSWQASERYFTPLTVLLFTFTLSTFLFSVLF